MNNTYQLFLKLKQEEEGLRISQLLQDIDFNLKKQSQASSSHYQNLYFYHPTSSNQYELHIKISPKESLIDTVAIRLYFGCTLDSLSHLFDQLSRLQQLIPFHLLDTELCNKYFVELSKVENLNESFTGLSHEAQLKIEQKAYIPVNFVDFQNNYFEVQKRKQFFSIDNNEGERAPDDSKAMPEAKGYTT